MKRPVAVAHRVPRDVYDEGGDSVPQAARHSSNPHHVSSSFVLVTLLPALEMLTDEHDLGGVIMFGVFRLQVRSHNNNGTNTGTSTPSPRA